MRICCISIVIFISVFTLIDLINCVARIENTQLHLRRYRKRKNADTITRNTTWNSKNDTSLTSITTIDNAYESVIDEKTESFHQSHLLHKHMCFYSNLACERGTEIAMFDYAHYVEKMFGMKSYIIFPRYLESANQWTDENGMRLSLRRFQDRFTGRVSFCGEPYSEQLEVNLQNISIVYPVCSDLTVYAKKSLHCDALYIIKNGLRRLNPIYPMAFRTGNLTSSGGSNVTTHLEELPTAVHAVFRWDPHGTAYAGISREVTGEIVESSSRPIVPHIVAPPSPDVVASVTSLRLKLRIPPAALVVCRHGGADSFDIPFAHEAVLTLLLRHNHSSLHFVFLNTRPLMKRLEMLILNQSVPMEDALRLKSQIHFMKAVSSELEKERYFTTCDCMLHARAEGETFGLSIAEFSVRNKPVITKRSGHRLYADMHGFILKDKAFYYEDKVSLMRIIEGFLRDGIPKRNFTAYEEFSPDKVMETFKKVFLNPLFRS